VKVEFFDIRDARRMEEALAIRLRVFVEEQGVPLDLEIDEHDRDDPAARHALVRSGVDAVATGRFYDAGEATAQIGRMAVLAPWRGQGAGALLLAALTAEAGRAGFRRARLDAQVHAIGFYHRAGYREDGERLWDAGILHQPMSRELGAPGDAQNEARS
jgi:predicted GNAT family N-acyltransferase